MLVSVIIPHFNDIAHLQVCCAHLLSQTWPSGQMEVIVADNGSHCGIDAVQRAAPAACVVLTLERGAGPARNAGVAASHGGILAFIDSDCLPDMDWIAAGVKSLADHDFTGGDVRVFPRDAGAPNGVEAYEMVFNFDFNRYITRKGFTGTGNMFVPRAIFDQVGNFRAGVAEDMDWSFRARLAGYRIGHAPSAVVNHPARHDWAELERRWSRMTCETFALACEQLGGRWIFLLKALLMPASALPHACRMLVSPRLHGPRARLRGIAVLLRLRLWRTRRMIGLVAGWRHPSANAGAMPGQTREC